MSPVQTLSTQAVICGFNASLCFQGFVNEYPDVKIDQLVNVLLTRGDVSRGEARQVINTNTPIQQYLTVI